MNVVRAGSLVLDGSDCARLGPLFGRAVRSALARGEPVDRHLLDLAEAVEVCAAAWRTSAGGRTEGSSGPLELEPADTDLTVTAAAALLGRSPRRVRQLLEAGQLAGRKLGPVWKVSADGVRRRLSA